MALAALGVGVWYVLAAPRSQVLGPAAYRGSPQENAVALTFDDGPGPDTPAILEILRQAGARATFFLCGENVERRPELARRIAEEGHEIGNHTHSHPRLLGRSPGRIALEVERAQKVIEHHTGQAPTLFRPPYGLRWFGLFPVLRQNHLRAVMWSVNSRDWKRTAAEITDSVLRQSRAGAIILLHDGMPPRKKGNRRATVESLPAILRGLQGRYRFRTASEILSPNQSGPPATT